jgi:hypothetical protein
MVGVHKKYLYYGNQIVAMNVWDENYKYINYRFCLVKSDERYLDEFCRFLFYTDMDVYFQRKLINDGGVLGSSGLEFFKDKMNPLRKRTVYSYFKTK